MILGTVDGTELEYGEGDFTLSTGEAMSTAEIVALDGEGGVDWLEESYRRWFYDNQDGIVASGAALTPYVALADPEWRAQRLSDAIQWQVLRGARVESRERGSAVLVFGRRVDHLTHFIIALFTCGIWVPVWI
ncbi:MAG: hypothetical protein Q7J82_06750, partial [Coriobacteriia bacterium]|nr:hypothetical protein [Coriobacteriia bacterium]